jgi:hypothetical protein
LKEWIIKSLLWNMQIMSILYEMIERRYSGRLSASEHHFFKGRSALGELILDVDECA